MIEKITITIYYTDKIDKQKQIEKHKKMIDDTDNIEFAFFNFDDIEDDD